MKLKLPCIILGTVLLSALTVYAGNVNTNNREVFSFSNESAKLNFMPNIDCDLSALDPRDMSNLPVKNSFAKKELHSLFMNNLASLLIYSEIKSLAAVLKVIKNKLKLNAFSFARNLPVLVVNIIDIFFQQIKKFLAAVFVCLSGFLAMKIARNNFAFCALQSVVSKIQAPVNLRC